MQLVTAPGRQSIIDVPRSISTLLLVLALLGEGKTQSICNLEDRTPASVVSALAEVLRTITTAPDDCIPVTNAQLRRWLEGVSNEHVDDIVEVFGIEGISFPQTAHCISDVHLKGHTKHF